MIPHPPPSPCPGPLVWFGFSDQDGTEGAVLECNSCDYVIATGSFNDPAHAHTELGGVA